MSSPPLGEEFLDVPIAHREAQVEPDRTLDDHRRKAVAAVGYFSHRGSLPMVSPSSYPVILTKPFEQTIRRQLGMTAGRFGNFARGIHRSRTEGSNPVPSSNFPSHNPATQRVTGLGWNLAS